MEINNVMDLSASITPRARASQDVKRREGKAFLSDMQNAAERQRPVRRSDDNDKSVRRGEEPVKTENGADSAEAEITDDNKLNNESETNENQSPEDAEMAAAIAPFIPVIGQATADTQETEETTLTGGIGEIPMDMGEGNDKALITDAQPGEHEAPLAEGSVTTQDAKFLEQALKDIKQAVASNEAERTVSAQPEIEPEQEVQEKSAAGEYDDHIIVKDEETQEEEANLNLTKSEKPGKPQKTETPQVKDVTQNAHVPLNPDAPEVPVAIKDGAVAPREAQQTFFESIVEQVETAVTQEKSELYIQLKPEVLGGLAIRLMMTSEGLSAQVRTSNQQLQSMVHSEIAQLEANLKDRGIEVVRMDVIYDQSASNDYLNQQQQGRWDEGGFERRGEHNAVRIIEETAAMNPYEKLYESMVPVEEDTLDSVEYSA